MSFIQKTVSPLWLNTALSPISIVLHGSPYNPIILCVRLSTVTKQPEGHGAESAPSTVLYAVTRRSLAALQPNIASSPARRIANLMVIWWSLAGHSHGICTGNSFRYYPRIQKAAGLPRPRTVGVFAGANAGRQGLLRSNDGVAESGGQLLDWRNRTCIYLMYIHWEEGCRWRRRRCSSRGTARRCGCRRRSG